MSDEIVAGSFRPIPENEVPFLEKPTPKELKPEASPDLVSKYQLFDQEVHPLKRIVYHPSSACDISPSVAFPDSKVVYVELNEEAVKALQKDGFEAHYASAFEYDPGNVDILIMQNPAISSTIPASHVVKGGYVLCNDYHKTATELQSNPDFKLKGLIRTNGNKTPIYDTENPEDYWEEIDTEEEFRNAPFSWGSISYEEAARVVEQFTGKRENVLIEYKKILNEASEEYEKLLKENPRLKGIIGEELIINHNGQTFVLQARLPSKKGTVDDLFVFERVTKTS